MTPDRAREIVVGDAMVVDGMVTKNYAIRCVLAACEEESRTPVVHDAKDITDAVQFFNGRREQFGPVTQIIADELTRLRAENAIFRNAQKACVDCDAPTMAEVDRMRHEIKRTHEDAAAIIFYILGSNQWANAELVARWNAEVTPTLILNITDELALAKAKP